MSEFHFFAGSGKGKIDDETYEKVSSLAKDNGVTFVYTKLPGDGYRHWFSARNYGHPFDQALANSIREQLKEQDIELP